MTHYAIATDINRCVGCLGCTVACNTVNNVPIGNFWNRVVRMGPTPKLEGSGQFPDVEMYFLTMQCQHCNNPSCVDVCPTGSSYVAEDGTVQIDEELCIGCQSCLAACPYGVRSLNEELQVVQKCNLCAEKTAQDELPQCVTQCSGRARYYGDLDAGIESFEGPAPINVTSGDDFKKTGDVSYEGTLYSRAKMIDAINPWTDDQVFHLTDGGTDPTMVYIMRDRQWLDVL